MHFDVSFREIDHADPYPYIHVKWSGLDFPLEDWEITSKFINLPNWIIELTINVFK